MIRLLIQLAAVVALSAMLLDAGDDLRRALAGPAAPATAAVTATTAPATEVAATGLEFKGRPLASYPETVARPVFFEGRRQPAPLKPATPVEVAVPVRAQPAPARISAEGLKLLGVMVAGGSTRALIEAPSQPAAWVSVGQKVQAWTVQAIRQNSVRLGGNTANQFATLSLYEGGGDN